MESRVLHYEDFRRRTTKSETPNATRPKRLTISQSETPRINGFVRGGGVDRDGFSMIIVILMVWNRDPLRPDRSKV
jgi:hypothetical protein